MKQKDLCAEASDHNILTPWAESCAGSPFNQVTEKVGFVRFEKVYTTGFYRKWELLRS